MREAQPEAAPPAAPKRRRRWPWVLLGGVAVGLGAAGVYLAWPTPRPALRAAPSGLNCVKVGQCAQDCIRRCESGIKKFSCMFECTQRCEARGCPTGREAHSALTSCVKRRCLFDCFGGPGEGCERCTRKRCTELRQACIDHRCEADAEARRTGGAGSSGSDPGS